MQRLTETEIRRSFVNATRSEVANINFPESFVTWDWERLDYAGWRDGRMPQRRYLVYELNGRTTGILLRAAESVMSRRFEAMRALSQSVQTADEVLLFTARRARKPGREGNTVGTYICAALNCSENVRADVVLSPDQPEPEMVVKQKIEGLCGRLDSFLGRVTEK